MTYRLPLNATVTTRTMHALPMTTPNVVKNARILLAHKASSATIQVSLRSIMILFISLSFVSRILPVICYADRAPGQRDNSPPLPKICPGTHEVSRAIPAPGNALADRSCPAPWRCRTSVAIRPRPDFLFPLQTGGRGKTSSAGRRYRFVRRRQSLHSFLRSSGGPGNNPPLQNRRRCGRCSIAEFLQKPHPPRLIFSWWRKTLREQAVPAMHRFFRGRRYASGRGRHRRRRSTARTFQNGSSRVAPENSRDSDAPRLQIPCASFAPSSWRLEIPSLRPCGRTPCRASRDIRTGWEPIEHCAQNW